MAAKGQNHTETWIHVGWKPRLLQSFLLASNVLSFLCVSWVSVQILLKSKQTNKFIMPCSWKQGEYLCNSLKLSQTFLSPSWSPLHPCTFAIWLAFLQTCFRWKFYSEVSGFKKKRNLLIGKQAQGPKVSCLTGNNEQGTWNVRSVYIPERFVTQLIRTIQGQLLHQHGVSLMNVSIVGAVPATQRGKFQTDSFLFPFFKITSHDSFTPIANISRLRGTRPNSLQVRKDSQHGWQWFLEGFRGRWLYPADRGVSDMDIYATSFVKQKRKNLGRNIIFILNRRLPTLPLQQPLPNPPDNTVPLDQVTLLFQSRINTLASSERSFPSLHFCKHCDILSWNHLGKQ